jgi:hypothetical protein
LLIEKVTILEFSATRRRLDYVSYYSGKKDLPLNKQAMPEHAEVKFPSVIPRLLQ